MNIFKKPKQFFFLLLLFILLVGGIDVYFLSYSRVNNGQAATATVHQMPTVPIDRTPVATVQQTPASAVFPPLTGEYPVGRKSYHLVDQTHDELITEQKDDKREVFLIVYYPAKIATDSQHTPYGDAVLDQMLQDVTGVPQGFFNGLFTNAYANVPITDRESSYPVVLFWPGNGNLALFHSSTLEDIASHGYIVVGISPPYNTTAQDLEAFKEKYDQQVAEWVGDERFVLQHLREINTTDFQGRIDLSRVGAVGHSFGGAVALLAAAQDASIVAALDMDGVFGGDVAANGLRKPFMLMTSGEHGPRLFPDEQRIMLTTPSGYQVHLKDSTHNTYTTDFTLLAPAHPGTIATDQGTIKGTRAVAIINAYVIAFLDKHVKGKGVSLLDDASADYPEVIFTKTS